MKKQAIITLLSLLLAAFPASAQDGAAASGGNAPQAQGPKWVRKYVVPLILAASDAAGNRQFTFDTTLFITYTPGLAGLGAGPGASVDLFLFDDTAGDPLRSPSGQAVCNPCSFTLLPKETKHAHQRSTDTFRQRRYGRPQRREIRPLLPRRQR